MGRSGGNESPQPPTDERPSTGRAPAAASVESPRTPTPRIAVVIPAYRAADTLADTLASIIEQDIADWEAVIVDDGSADTAPGDTTWATAQQLAATDDRITAITQPNSGVSAARNAGIAASTAPIVGFVDADDQWDPTWARRMIEEFDAQPSAGVVFCRTQICSPTMEPTGDESTMPDGPVDLELLVATNPAATASTMGARRTALTCVGGFAEDLRRCEDHHFLLAAHLAGWDIVAVDAALVRYRTSPNGLSSDLEGMLHSWEAMVERLGEARLGPTLPAARAEHFSYLARRSIRLGNPPATTLRYLRGAIAADPKVPVRKLIAAPAAVNRKVVGRVARVKSARRKASDHADRASNLPVSAA